MASRQALYPPRSAHPESILIPCSFAPNGSSAPASSGFEGPISAVTRTGTGAYTITLKDKWPGILAVLASLQLTSGTGVVTVSDVDVSAKTIKLRTYQESSGTLTAADISANANNRVNLMIVARNTNLKVKA